MLYYAGYPDTLAYLDCQKLKMEKSEITGNKIYQCASRIWDYHVLGQPLSRCRYICVFCSNDLRVADWSAELYKRDQGEVLVFSGGIAHTDDLLNTGWDRPEAEVFANRAVQLGVSQSHIIFETGSTNSGENVTNVRRILQDREDFDGSAIIVQKPFMERRTYATIQKLWPELSAILTSPPISFDEYIIDQNHFEILVNTVVGDLHRIIIYPQMGYQSYQHVPGDVLKSFNFLVQNGYTKHLVK